MHYKYCPNCGKKLIDKVAGDEGYVPYCEACKKYWFDTFSSCVIVLVANEFHEIALLTQNYLSPKYKSFVSGYIVPKENAEQSAIREVQEELGITLERLKYAGTYWFDANDMLMHGFIGYAKKCDFKLSSEIDDAQWVHVSKIEDLIFPERPGDAMHPMLKIYLDKHF